MGWPKGTPRPEGAGRRAGTPNKKTLDLFAKCEALGIDPFEELLKIASPLNENPDHRLQALKEVCQYLYPKRKAMEVSGSLNTSISSIVDDLSTKSDDELRELIQEELKK